jgi:hypothetical protein
MEEFRPVLSDGENNNHKISNFKQVRSIEIITNTNKKLTNLKLN